MILDCVNCGKANKIFGFIWRRPGSLEGQTPDTNRLICGHCGLSWVVTEQAVTDRATAPPVVSSVEIDRAVAARMRELYGDDWRNKVADDVIRMRK